MALINESKVINSLRNLKQKRFKIKFKNITDLNTLPIDIYSAPKLSIILRYKYFFVPLPTLQGSTAFT